MNSNVENLQIVETEIEESQSEHDKEKVISEDSVLDPSGTDCSESSTEDSISNSESLKNDDSESSITEKLRDTIAYQQNLIEQNSNKCKLLEQENSELKQTVKDLEAKLDLAIRKKNAAIKEKEAVVVRYAVSEKNVLKEKQQKEIAEKKLSDALRETDILQHKVQTMVSEKGRICQLLDNKLYDNKILQQELEQKKSDYAILENKLKWAQTNLRTELDINKETQAKLENMNAKYQEAVGAIDQIKRESEEYVKSYRNSEENRAHVLDSQVREQQASLILLKHERKDKEEQISILQKQVEKLQSKQKEMLQENNHLSLKVQQLEKDRSENELKLSELRGCADQQRQDVVDLQTKSVQLEQLKLQLKHEQEQLAACNDQMSLLKQRNQELEGDMETCRSREAELLLFTQQLTDKNVRLQSEFTSLETRVQQLSCEQTLLKRQFKEQESKATMCSAKLMQEKQNYEDLIKKLTEKSKMCEQLKQEAVDQKSENILIKRKYDMSLREVNRELQQYHKKLEKLEDLEKTSNSNSSSNSSLNVSDSHAIDQQTLIEHIVKLQKISAKKSEKIDFLEEHVNNLVIELQKKSKQLQGYVTREQKSSIKRDSIKVK